MKLILLVFICLLVGCKEPANTSMDPVSNKTEIIESSSVLIDLDVSTIMTRILPPEGYIRNDVPTSSFAEYLRTLRLKPFGSKVKYYNGKTKNRNDVYSDVIDLDIGEKDLHQCADAVMRLKAEYLWNTSQFDKIHFNFTNGHLVAYKQWMDGYRMNVKGNKTWWSLKETPSNTYNDFWDYMELIFMYAGTASLEKELVKSNWKDASIGDVLIQGGHPGHAVILVDKAIHKISKEPIYLLAQSYMPAQEIQILINPLNKRMSPWYKLNEGKIVTPEWIFNSNDLMKFD